VGYGTGQMIVGVSNPCSGSQNITSNMGYHSDSQQQCYNKYMQTVESKRCRNKNDDIH
jgi:hypothetical protein